MNLKLYFVIGLLIVLSQYVFSQIDNYNGVWINNYDNNGLIVNGKRLIMEGRGLRELNSSECTMISDTLRCVKRSTFYPYGRIEEKIKRVQNYDFKILIYNDTVWQIKPTSTESKRLFGSNQKRTYTKQENIPDRILDFERIIYHQRPFSLEIDSSKTVHLRTRKLSNSANSNDKPILITEYFEGVLDEAKFQELLKLLRISKIEKLNPNHGESWTHVPYKSFTLYLNEDKKRLSFQRIPIVMQKLNDFLISICQNHDFNKSYSAYDFER